MVLSTTVEVAAQPVVVVVVVVVEEDEEDDQFSQPEVVAGTAAAIPAKVAEMMRVVFILIMIWFWVCS